MNYLDPARRAASVRAWRDKRHNRAMLSSDLTRIKERGIKEARRRLRMKVVVSENLQPPLNGETQWNTN